MSPKGKLIVIYILLLVGSNHECLAKGKEEMKYCFLHSLLGRPQGTCGNSLDETVKDVCEARAIGLPYESIYDIYSKRSQAKAIPSKRKTENRLWEIPKHSALDFLRPQLLKRQGKIAEYDDGDLKISIWDGGNQNFTIIDLNRDTPYDYSSHTLEKGIYCECCIHHCSIGEILEYCH